MSEDLISISNLSKTYKNGLKALNNVSLNITPALKGSGRMIFIDLSNRKQRMGGSALHQSYQIIDNDTPKIENIDVLIKFFNFSQDLIKNKIITAYHDKSDGGAFTALSEMFLISFDNPSGPYLSIVLISPFLQRNKPIFFIGTTKIKL